MWTEVAGAGEHVSDGLSGPVPQTGPEQDPSPPTQTARYGTSVSPDLIPSWLRDAWAFVAVVLQERLHRAES